MISSVIANITSSIISSIVSSATDSTPDIDTVNELLLDANGLYNALHLDADGLGVTLLEDKKQ